MKVYGSKKASLRAGFTLTEVMVAMGIIAFAVIVVLAAIPSAAQGVDDAEMRSKGQKVAHLVAKDIRHLIRYSTSSSKTLLPTLPGEKASPTISS